MSDFGQIADPDRLMAMCPDPGDGLADPGQMAVGTRKLAKLCALRTLQQPKQDLAFEHDRQHGNLRWPVKQPHHPTQRIEQILIDGRGGETVAPERGLVIDLNGFKGHRTVQQAAEIVIHLATLDADGPNAGYFNDDGPLPW